MQLTKLLLLCLLSQKRRAWQPQFWGTRLLVSQGVRCSKSRSSKIKHSGGERARADNTHTFSAMHLREFHISRLIKNALREFHISRKIRNEIIHKFRHASVQIFFFAARRNFHHFTRTRTCNRIRRDPGDAFEIFPQISGLKISLRNFPFFAS